MAVFRLSVELLVNATCRGLPRLNNSEIRSLVSYIILDASRDASWAPLPELPKFFMASATASMTQSGFLMVVAALSK